MQHVTVVSGLAPDRQHVFSVLVKRSYVLHDGRPLVERETPGFLRADTYHDAGDPEASSVWMEDESAPFKPATDIVVLGRAHAPGGGPAQAVTVGVEVGSHRKLLAITGDRHAIHVPGGTPRFTDPVPFTTMPIRYEYAYGGVDARSRPGMPFHYPRNPVGRGLAVLNMPETVHGLPLPNIENPQDPLTPERLVLNEEGRWNEQPFAQGLGWFQKTWYPRCSFVGALPPHVQADTVMREEALGLVPAGQIALGRQFRLPSFDVRFNNGGSLGMVLPSVHPGTRIRLARLSPEPMLTFTLPDRWPRLALDIGKGAAELAVALHTVLIDVEDRRVDMIWRGALPYPGPAWLPQMTRLHAEVA